MIRDVPLNELNVIANQEEILPYINPLEPRVDLAWVYNIPGAMVKGWVGTFGAMIFIPKELRVYEIHYLFAGHRPWPAIKGIVNWAFTEGGVSAIMGATPRENRAARFVNRALGGSPVAERIDEAGRPCIVYLLANRQ